MGRLSVLAEYGFKSDPFRSIHLDTADVARVKRLLGMAVESRAMVFIVADRGNGKSYAVDSIIRDMEVKDIRLQTLGSETILIGDIERALITDLSQEDIKRTREIRARQLRRVLGEASRQQEIVLVLEEAHRLHPQTLRSLKRLREMNWMGQSPLLTVVLVGQADTLGSLANMEEVSLRTDVIYMKGLTQSEVREYVATTVGRYFEDSAIEAVSRLKCSRNCLDLQKMIIALMERALSGGEKKVTVFEVFDVYGGGFKEMRERVGMSLSDMHTETGISKSTLSLFENDKLDKLTDEAATRTREAVAEVLRRRMEGKTQPEHVAGA